MKKNHNINNEFLSVIRELSANVNALKKDMNSVTNDIQTLKGTRHVSTAAGSPDLAVTTELSLRTNMTIQLWGSRRTPRRHIT